MKSLFTQYLPQIWLNYKRKSTEGFHIGGVLLDFSGGVLSILQMDIYCVIDQSSEQLTGNIPKLALGIVTLLFNIILVWQHYVFYLGNVPTVDDKEPLLSNSDQPHYRSINADAEANGVLPLNSSGGLSISLEQSGKEEVRGMPNGRKIESSIV